MKTIIKISKLLFSTIVILTVSSIGVVGYAEEKDIGCCTGQACPTLDSVLGEKDVVITVTKKGVRMKEGGEVVTLSIGDDEYFELLDAAPSEQNQLKIDAAELDVSLFAKCSGSSKWRPISENGASIPCPVGEGVNFDLERPQCVSEGYPKVVVEVTRVKQKSAREIMEEASLGLDERWKEIEKLEREKRGVLSEIDRLEDEIIGVVSSGGGSKHTVQMSDSGYLETIKALQNSKYMKQDPCGSSREISWGTKQFKQSKDQGFVRDLLNTIAVFTIGSGSDYGSFGGYGPAFGMRC